MENQHHSFSFCSCVIGIRVDDYRYNKVKAGIIIGLF